MYANTSVTHVTSARFKGVSNHGTKHWHNEHHKCQRCCYYCQHHECYYLQF